MKHLILMRHAKSSWEDPALSDRLRPLNQRGQRDAPKMGRHLASLGLAPQHLMTSPATRTLETARHVARQLDFSEARIVLNEALYDASGEALLAVIETLDSAFTTVLMVAHHPGLPELTARLTGDGPLHFPTAAFAVLDLEVDAWRALYPGCARLSRFEIPRALAP